MTNFGEMTRSFLAFQTAAPEFFMEINGAQDLERATAFLYAFDEEKGEAFHPLAPLADLLMQRIVAYEADHSPIPDADGPEMLAFLMEQQSMTQRELAQVTGIPQSTISDLVNRKRQFTADHLRKLATFFNVTPALFL